MTTLAADSPLDLMVGNVGSTPCVGSDIVYEGAMVGDNGAGYGRPLVASDKFLGHNIEKVDNSSGSAGDKNISHYTGKYRLVVALVGTITDVGQPVYASDDATYTFDPSGNSYVGKIRRYVSATKMEVEFDPLGYDEFGPDQNRVTKSADYTTLAGDNGRIIYVDTDAKTITLIATVAGYRVRIVNLGSLGTVGLTVDFNVNDKSLGGCGLAAGADGAHITNTKATAQRGDYLELLGDGAAGWNVVGKRGTWVQS